MEIERVRRLIKVVRGARVLLDRDVACLYGVSTGHLNRAVKRNRARFPADFLFQLTEEEADLICQSGISSSWGGSRQLAMAFTEQGVAMLSGILRSGRAIKVNIAIMRAFIMMRAIAKEREEAHRRRIGFET